MSTIRNLEPQAHFDFPIEKLRTIKNYIAIVNTERFLHGEKWESETIREEGIIRVNRIA